MAWSIRPYYMGRKRIWAKYGENLGEHFSVQRHNSVRQPLLTGCHGEILRELEALAEQVW
jgi:hypothetical protein